MQSVSQFGTWKSMSCDELLSESARFCICDDKVNLIQSRQSLGGGQCIASTAFVHYKFRRKELKPIRSSPPTIHELKICFPATVGSG